MSIHSQTTRGESRQSPGRDAGVTRIAAIQMASGPSVEANLREAGHLIALAARGGAKLVALPEHFALLGLSERDKVGVREEQGRGPIQNFLSATARRHGIWLVGGSVPLVASVPDKVRNSMLVYDARGELVARYDKIHLFGFEMGSESFAEERTIEPGDEVVALDSPFGRLGLSICYDVRFPELYRSMGALDLILVPAAFTETTGKAHWETLLRARAIENLCYVLAPAQGGYHENGRETHGDSMIVDPWGVVLDRLPRGSGVVLAGMNPAHMRRLRSSLPALSHRKLGAP
jgi:deaminated glutathione amidase